MNEYEKIYPERLGPAPKERSGASRAEDLVEMNPEVKALLKRKFHLEKFEHPTNHKVIFKELPDDFNEIVTSDYLDIIEEKYLQHFVLRKIQLGVIGLCSNPQHAWKLRSQPALSFANEMAMWAHGVIAKKGAKRKEFLAGNFTFWQLRKFLHSLSGGWRARYELTDLCVKEWRKLTYRREGKEPAPITRDIARLWRSNGSTNADETKNELIRSGYSERDAEMLKAPPEFTTPDTENPEDDSGISAFERLDVINRWVWAGGSPDSLPPDMKAEEDLSVWLKIVMREFLRFDFIVFGLRDQIRIKKEKLAENTNAFEIEKLTGEIATYELELEFVQSTLDGDHHSRRAFLRNLGHNNVIDQDQSMGNASNNIKRAGRGYMKQITEAVQTMSLAEVFSSYGTSVVEVCERISAPQEMIEKLERANAWKDM